MNSAGAEAGDSSMDRSSNQPQNSGSKRPAVEALMDGPTIATKDVAKSSDSSGGRDVCGHYAQ